MQNDKTGLTEKYIVLKKQGEGEPTASLRYNMNLDSVRDTKGNGIMAWPKRTWSFVLSPEKDDDYGVASRIAMREYASQIAYRNPQLAADIEARLEGIMEKLSEGSSEAPQ